MAGTTPGRLPGAVSQGRLGHGLAERLTVRDPMISPLRAGMRKVGLDLMSSRRKPRMIMMIMIKRVSLDDARS